MRHSILVAAKNMVKVLMVLSSKLVLVFLFILSQLNPTAVFFTKHVLRTKLSATRVLVKNDSLLLTLKCLRKFGLLRLKFRMVPV